MVSLLQDILENDQRLTMLQLVDKMKNKQKELGADIKKEEMEQLVVQLILDRVLKEEFQHTAYSTNAYVTVGPFAKLVLQGKKIVKLEISGKPKNRDGNMKSAKHNRSLSGLELKLDELRKELSSGQGGIFPHSVLSSQQMSVISTQKPNSVQELETIIGKLKAERYGNRILDEIKKYTSSEQPDNGILSNEEEGSDGRASKRPKTKKGLVVIESSHEES